MISKLASLSASRVLHE